MRTQLLKLAKLPIVWVAVFGLLMLSLQRNVPIGHFQISGEPFPALAIAVIGIIIVLLGGYAFRRANTTFSPLEPEKASRLVTGGVYRISRNPMYLGFLFLLIAWGIYLGNMISLLALPGFVWCINTLHIRPEERALQEKFGEGHRDYCARVRRWI